MASLAVEKASAADRRCFRWLLFILALTFSIRSVALAYVHHLDLIAPRELPRIFTPDSVGYDSIARAIVRTGRFAPDPGHPETPEIIRTPAYPVFLAAFYKLFGDRAWIALEAQIAVSVATIGLAYGVARRLWGGAAGLAAAALLALDVNSGLYSQLLLTETLFAFFVFVSAVALARWAERMSGWGSLTLAGAALALATLTRPVTLYFIWPLALLLAIGAWRRRGAARAALTVAYLLAPWIALIGGWQYHNFLRTGSWKLCHIDSVNLFMYRGAGIVALQDRTTLEAAQHKLATELPDMRGWTPVQQFALQGRRGLALIKAHPFLHLQLQAVGLAKMIFSSGMGSVWAYFNDRLPSGPLGDLLRLHPRDWLHAWVKRRPLALACFALSALYVAIFYLLMLMGIARVWRNRKMEGARMFLHLIILLYVAYLFIVPAGPEAYSRFKVPIMPLLALYAGLGLAGWMKRGALAPKHVQRAPVQSH